MSEIPGDLKFLKSHEWARIEDSGRITVGISDHAQGLLGDLVYVELPNVGDTIEAGASCAVVESVKAASDVYSPVSGTIVEVNAALADKPETINEDAYGEGWLFVVQPSEADPMAELLSPDRMPQDEVDSLIAEANRHGGLDNITAIIVRVDSVEAPADENVTTQKTVAPPRPR